MNVKAWVAAFGLAMALLVLCAQAALALSVDQVIALRKAGVSNQTLLKILHNETEMRKRGYSGRYLVKQRGGSEVVVYEAKSARGVVDYPVDPDGEAGGVSALSAALDLGQRTAGKGTSMAAAAGAQGYTVHLYSYKDMARATRSLELLKRYGVNGQIVPVDLQQKGRWYRVVCGDFASRKAAREYGESLKSQGVVDEYWVIKR